jgi:hypothetical protein
MSVRVGTSAVAWLLVLQLICMGCLIASVRKLRKEDAAKIKGLEARISEVASRIAKGEIRISPAPGAPVGVPGVPGAVTNMTPAVNEKIREIYCTGISGSGEDAILSIGPYTVRKGDYLPCESVRFFSTFGNRALVGDASGSTWMAQLWVFEGQNDVRYVKR